MTDTRLRYLITAEDKASATFARLKGDMASLGASSTALGRVLGGIGPQLVGAFSVAALTSWIKTTVDGIDALNDLKDATGASIENLSALEDVAARTGTSMDTAGDAVLKLNKALNTASDPKSDAAEAIKRLGLNVKELQQIDPVLALQKVGIALNGFADNGAKGRLQLTLLGKATKEQAAFLKELGDAGQLNATITTAQAEATEKFNKQIFDLQKNVQDASRNALLPFVSDLNAMGEAMDKVATPGDKFLVFWNRLIESSRDLQGDLISKALGKTPEKELIKLGQELAAIDQRLAAAGTFNVTTGGFEARRQEILQRIAFLQAMNDAGNAANAGNEGRRERVRPSLADEAGKAGKKAKPYEVGSFALQEAGDLRAAFEAIDKINREWQPAEWFGGESSLYEAELIRKAFEDIEEVNKGAAKEAERLAKEAEDALKLGSDTGKEIGLVFASAAGKAITDFENLRGVLKGILADIAQIAVRESITKPLESFLTPVFKGFSLGSILPGFDTGIDYVPRDMPAIIHKGERVVTAAENRRGAGGAQLSYSPSIRIDSRSDAAQVGAIVSQALQADRQNLFAHLKAQGVLA